MARAVAFLGFLILASCGGVYRYQSLQRQDFVVPPGIRSAAPEASVERALGKLDSSCQIETESLSILVRRGQGRVRLASTAQDGPNRMPMFILNDFERVRERLARCRGGEALLARLPHLLPMASRAQHQLLYGALAGTGILEVRSPIVLRYLAPQGDGVVVSRYRTQPDGSLLRFEGAPSPVDSFADGYSHFRLLFLTYFSNADHKEILVRGSSIDDLSSATPACRADAKGGPCLQLERGAIIAAELPVTVDGKLRFVPVDASAGEAAGRRRIVSIRRGARLRPVRWDRGADPTGLALLGGEMIVTEKHRK